MQFEVRQRVESRSGPLFGRDRDLTADFIRTKAGLTYRPSSWIKIVGVAQDTRAPLYGAKAPANVRDPLDLQQAYVEVFSSKQRGFGVTIGRLMINLGDTRLIGSPQWAYVARTWDSARLYHVSKHARMEALFLSTGVPKGDAFNKPVLGDRIWGTYNTFEIVAGKHTVDVYALRHDQNRPGGFSGKGTLGVTLVGLRSVLALPNHSRFTWEGIVQRGHVGPAPHRASAFVVQGVHSTELFGKPLDLMAEYKFASGTDPKSGRSGTFDSLYAGVHDKFGHVDLMGWKNVKNTRSSATLTIRPGWSWVLMYNNSWLANPFDAVYATNGRPVARAPLGNAGTHIGQEWDLYTNYTSHGVTVGIGGGRFQPGEFIRKTTPSRYSGLLYLSTGYSF